MATKKKAAQPDGVQAVLARVLDAARASVRFAEAAHKGEPIAVEFYNVLHDCNPDVAAHAIAWPDSSEVGSQARTDLYAMARAESSVQRWASAHGKPVPPNTFRAVVNERNQMATTTKASGGASRKRSTSTGRTPGVSVKDRVRFTHDGMPVHESHSLGGVAFHFTLGMGKGGGKLNSKELHAWLTEHGIADVYEPGWSIELPTDPPVVLGAIKPSEVEAARAAAKASKSSARPTAKQVAKGAAKRTNVKSDKPQKVTREAATKASEKRAAAKTQPPDLSPKSAKHPTRSASAVAMDEAAAKRAAATKAAKAKKAAATKRAASKPAASLKPKPKGAASKPLAKPMAPRKAASAKTAAKRTTSKRAR